MHPTEGEGEQDGCSESLYIHRTHPHWRELVLTQAQTFAQLPPMPPIAAAAAVPEEAPPAAVEDERV